MGEQGSEEGAQRANDGATVRGQEDLDRHGRPAVPAGSAASPPLGQVPEEVSGHIWRVETGGCIWIECWVWWWETCGHIWKLEMGIYLDTVLCVWGETFECCETGIYLYYR